MSNPRNLVKLIGAIVGIAVMGGAVYSVLFHRLGDSGNTGTTDGSAAQDDGHRVALLLRMPASIPAK